MEAKVKNTTKKASVNQEAKKESKYKETVLNTNKLLKQELKSIGACKTILLDFSEVIELDKNYKSYLLSIKKDQQKYEALKQVVKPSKKGNYSPYGVLQGLYRLIYKDVKKVPVKSEK